MRFNCLKATVPKRGDIDIYFVRKETGFIYMLKD